MSIEFDNRFATDFAPPIEPLADLGRSPRF